MGGQDSAEGTKKGLEELTPKEDGQAQDGSKDNEPISNRRLISSTTEADSNLLGPTSIALILGRIWDKIKQRGQKCQQNIALL